MLKIGLDLDGVVIDSETTFRTYEELFDIEKGRNTLFLLLFTELTRFVYFVEKALHILLELDFFIRSVKKLLQSEKMCGKIVSL